MNRNKEKIYFIVQIIVLLTIIFFTNEYMSKFFMNMIPYFKGILSYFKNIKFNLFHVVINYLIISFFDIRIHFKALRCKYDVEISLDKIFKIMYIPTLKIRNTDIKRYKFLEQIIEIPAIILSIELLILSFFCGINSAYEFTIITAIFIIPSRIKDILIIVEAYMSPNVMYIHFNEYGEKILKKETNIKPSHINTYFLYKEYENYSIEELYMEKMIISTKIFKYTNKRFFDTYIVPILMITISSTPTILSLCLGEYIKRLDTRLLSNEIEQIISLCYTILGLISIIVLFTIIIHKVVVNYNDISKLKLRENLIDDLIIKKENFKHSLKCRI